MTIRKLSRNYEKASLVAVDDGYAVHLDERPARTPKKATVVVPTFALAQGVVAEWDRQSEQIDVSSMPLTRIVNAAIDRVRADRERIVAQTAGYAETDLLCYRAEQPAELAARQERGWTPALEWLASRHGITLKTTTGVIPCAQDPQSVARLTELVAERDEFALTGLHLATIALGSLVLGLALEEGHLDWRAVWSLARIDEDFQIEKWGEDEEAATHRAALEHSLRQYAHYIDLLRT